MWLMERALQGQHVPLSMAEAIMVPAEALLLHSAVLQDTPSAV